MLDLTVEHSMSLDTYAALATLRRAGRSYMHRHTMSSSSGNRMDLLEHHVHASILRQVTSSDISQRTQQL